MPTLPKPYKYKRHGRTPWTPHKAPVKVAGSQELPLTGQVQGKQARADEERFIREASQIPSVLSQEFRKVLGAAIGTPGWLELDDLVITQYGARAFEIDDTTFVHRGSRAQAEEMIKDSQRVKYLASQGIIVSRIEHIDANKLQTDYDARRLAWELLA